MDDKISDEDIRLCIRAFNIMLIDLGYWNALYKCVDMVLEASREICDMERDYGY